MKWTSSCTLLTLDVLWVLYDQVLRISPDSAADDDRDRFLLSKGHAPEAFYAVLAANGFIDLAALPGFGTFGSTLGHHPDRNLITGVEIASGSLGHGLPIWCRRGPRVARPRPGDGKDLRSRRRR